MAGTHAMITRTRPRRDRNGKCRHGSRRHPKRIATALALLLAFALAPDRPAHAISITLEPSATEVELGEIVSLDIVVGGLTAGGAPSVGGFDLDVVRSGNSLQFQDASFGSLLGTLDVGAIASSALTGGFLMDLFEVSFLSPSSLDGMQPDSFVLATISFVAVQDGSSTLFLSQADVSDAFASPLIATHNSVNINVIPEPGTAMLVGFGIAGFAILRRSRRWR